MSRRGGALQSCPLALMHVHAAGGLIVICLSPGLVPQGPLLTWLVHSLQVTCTSMEPCSETVSEVTERISQLHTTEREAFSGVLAQTGMTRLAL